MEANAIPTTPIQATSIDSNEGTKETQKPKTNQEPIMRSSSREASESTDHFAIDTNKMTEQLRVVFKEVAESQSEKDTTTGFPGPRNAPHPSELDPNDNEVYRKALACVPKYIHGLGLECQVAMAKVLNVERDDYKDYRLVADSLGLPTTSINVVEDMPNQMMKVFKQCGSKPGKDLVEALRTWGRFDAMRVLVTFFHDRGSLSPSLSLEEPPKQLQRQRQLTGSLNEGMLQGRLQRGLATEEDTSHPRSVSMGASPVAYDVTPHPTESDTEEDCEGWDKTDFEFWNSIPGDRQFKKLKDVKKQFEKLLEHDGDFKQKFGYTWKLIVHTLKLDYSSGGSQIVTEENFRRMLAFLGSATDDENSCMKRAYGLMKKSMRKVQVSHESLNLSWFAGHMTAEDANDRLLQHQRGTFLIRFSTGAADKGWYVLAIRTECKGVFEFRIEQFQDNQLQRKFRLDGTEHTFDNLPDLVHHYEINEKVKDEDEDISEFLKTTCPNLPLNEICRGYKKAATKSKGKKK